MSSADTSTGGAQNNPPPFYYKGTDSAPPAGAQGYPMTGNNLGPALVVWLFLTTNPNWIVNIYQGNPNAYMGAVSDIAAATGLTAGSVQFILDRTRDDSTRGAMITVANAFQSINDANADADRYFPPCPTIGTQVLQLAPKAIIQNA